MPFILTFLIYVLLALSNVSFALEQKNLELSLHRYYQLNISINRYWMNDSNLKYKAETVTSLELMNQAMKNLLDKKYSAEEYKEIKNSWISVHNFINENSLIEKGYSDVSLIASYRVYLDKVRQAMLQRYHHHPATSDISNILMLFDRVISTYVEVNTDAFGSFIRSATDEDMNLAKIADKIDLSLEQFGRSNSISQEDLKIIKTKWNFIRRIVADSNSQSLPFIVLLNGRKIIQVLEKYN